METMTANDKAIGDYMVKTYGTKDVKVYSTKPYLKADNITVSLGNGKLDNSIMIFNLPAIKTCPNCKDCKKTCYARKFEKLYPTVLPCREKNYQESLSCDFYIKMMAIINKAITKGCTSVRVHESGDFYSQEYADTWTHIANHFPEIKFYAYTKSLYRPKASNFNIVESILPDGSINYGPIEEVNNKVKEFGYPLCPATVKASAKQTTCGKNCTICQDVKHVLFVKH